MRLGPAIADAAREHAWPGSVSPTTPRLASVLRSGALDADWEATAAVLAASARGQLLVANPAYLPAAIG